MTARFFWAAEGRQGEARERNGEPEDPPPARHLHEPAAEHRAQHVGGGEDGAHDAHVGAEFPRGHHIRDDGVGQNAQAASAQARQAAAADKHLHGHGQAAHRLAQGVQRQGHHDDVLAVVQVADLAVDGHDHGAHQDVGGGNPLHHLHAAQIAHDGGQRRGGDGLGQRVHEHRQQKPCEYECQPAAVHGPVRRVLVRIRAHDVIPRVRCMPSRTPL